MAESATPEPRPSLTEQATRSLRLRFLPNTGLSRSKGFGPALAVLAMTPPLIALLAAIFGFMAHERRLGIERVSAARLAQLGDARATLARRTRAAPFFDQPTISSSLDRLARAIPADDRLQMVSVGINGALSVQIDCHDPDVVLAALKADNLLGQLSIVDQQPAEEGVRITLGSRQP